MMRLSWSTWFGATALTILYAGAGYMASGEDVELSVNPALGFYNLMPNVGWLWPSLLWPFFAIILAVWAIARRRQNRAHTP